MVIIISGMGYTSDLDSFAAFWLLHLPLPLY